MPKTRLGSANRPRAMPSDPYWPVNQAEANALRSCAVELLLQRLVDGVGVDDLDQMVRRDLQLAERQCLGMGEQILLRGLDPVRLDRG